MASSELDITATFVATGIPLAHLLSPDETEVSAAETLPTVLCNSVPASSVLNVAIAHNITSMDYKRLRHLHEPLVRADPIAVDAEETIRYTWVVSSSRSGLHAKLADEDDPFLREYGGHPIIKEALNRTEFRYCQTVDQCLLLLQLLHSSPSSIDDPGAELEDQPRQTEKMAEYPTLIIAHDLLRLFLADPPDDKGEREGDMNMDTGKHKVELREGVTIEDYMQLMACLRSTASQVNPNSPPKLLVLEPSLPTGDLHFPVAVATSRSSRGRPTGQKKDGPGVKDALRWLFGEEQVWDVELSEESSGSSRASIEKDGERRLIIRKTAQSI